MSGMLLSFARPAWLLALLPLAFFGWRYWRSPWAATPWERVVDAHLLRHLLVERKDGGRISVIALAAAWLCAVLALSGPRFYAAPEQHTTQSSALHVLLVDMSPEAVPGLDLVKAKLPLLLRALGDAEVGLLIYAEEPYLVVPPTTDAGVIARFVPELAADAMPVAGNRPERALRMANAVLARSNAGMRSIVWVSSGSPRAALPPELDGVRLSVLHGGAQIDPALRAAVERSGGVHLGMGGDLIDWQKFAEALERRTRATALHRPSGGADIGYWLLLPLLPLAALRFRRGLLVLLPALVCAGLMTPTAEAARLSDPGARKLFDAGRYDEAAARFSDRRWQALAHYRAGRFAEAVRLLDGRNDPDSHYNRGNALAKLGNLQEALAAYESSLRLRPDDPDTLHNRDLVRRLLNRQDNNGPGGSGGGGGASSQQERDAARAADQWMRSVPDEPGTLLRRKLQIEHRRRATGEAERPW